MTKEQYNDLISLIKESHASTKNFEQRIYDIEEKLFIGNGKPSIMERLSLIENSSELAREEIGKIDNSIKILQTLVEEVKTLNDWRMDSNKKNIILFDNKLQFLFNIVSPIITGMLVYFFTIFNDKNVEAHQTTNNIQEESVSINK